MADRFLVLTPTRGMYSVMSSLKTIVPATRRSEYLDFLVLLEKMTQLCKCVVCNESSSHDL